GDSIHIVLAGAVAGLSRGKNREVGAKWLEYYNGTGTPALVMPDGSTTTNHTEYKKAWVLTCRDSLMQTFRRALRNFKSGYAIPQPPPPPKTFEVASGGDRITLSWSNEAESDPNFDGYVIYRSEGNVLVPKTVYREIFRCGNADAVNTFNDTTAVRNFDYYYFIQSKNDGSTNDIEPGKPLTSGMFWTLTTRPARLLRTAADSLSQVRVVPNPYDIRARVWQFGKDSQYDRIAFNGLPPMCKIRVFTERGDLIWETDHTNGSGDEIWDSMTQSRQIIVSGIYILHVEVTEDRPGFKKGDSVIRKFVVIR
ncbi:fibronectin, partial [bacterium]|nr:fibronectin [bacterium]